MKGYKPWQLGLGCLIGTGILFALLLLIFFGRIAVAWVKYLLQELIFGGIALLGAVPGVPGFILS